MKIRPLKIILAILEIFWSLPIIGLAIILSPVFSIIMIIGHLIAVMMSSTKELKISGNILGLIASIIVFIAFIIGDMNILENLDTIHLYLVVISWPLHILSVIYIFIGLSKDKKALKQEMNRNVDEYEKSVHYVEPIAKQVQDQMKEQPKLEPNQSREQVLIREKERFIKAIRSLLTFKENGLIFAIDTSFLIHRFNYALLQNILHNEHVTIYICTPVIEELNRMKLNERSLGKAARDALHLIDTYQKTEQIIFVETPELVFLRGHDLTNEHIDRVIGAYVQMQFEDTLRFVFLTDDVERRTRAVSAGLQVTDDES